MIQSKETQYFELKTNIRDNLLSERTGEQQLQTDLSKFYRPITDTQKATAREITERLKPIRESIKKLPQAMQPLGEEKPLDFGDIAEEYLQTPPLNRDTTLGIHDEKGLYYICNKQITIADNNIMVDDEKFKGTPSLWELIMIKNAEYFNDEDYNNYGMLMIKTNALHQNYDPNNPHPRSSKGPKGVIVIPSDPNALLERLDLLLARQKAGHTGVRNELVSICDELKREGFLDMESYKKLISNIKK